MKLTSQHGRIHAFASFSFNQNVGILSLAYGSASLSSRRNARRKRERDYPGFRRKKNSIKYRFADVNRVNLKIIIWIIIIIIIRCKKHIIVADCCSPRLNCVSLSLSLCMSLHFPSAHVRKELPWWGMARAHTHFNALSIFSWFSPFHWPLISFTVTRRPTPCHTFAGLLHLLCAQKCNCVEH